MLKKNIAWFLLLLTYSSFAESTPLFSFHDASITPACIAVFNDAVAEKPYVTAINLDFCQQQHANDLKAPAAQGFQAMYHENDKTGSHGFYGYQVIGQTPEHVFVVNTYTSGGGSGTFTNLMLLKLDQAKQFPNQTYTRLSYLGEVPGGDRCFDGLTDVQLQGNQLTFKQYHGQTAVDCSNPIPHSIDLSKI